MNGQQLCLQVTEACGSLRGLNVLKTPKFWAKHPALYLGLCILLGSSYAFCSHGLFVALVLYVGYTTGSGKKLLIGLLCAVCAWSYTHYRHPAVTIAPKGIYGTGTFHIENLKPYASFFNHSLLYQGTLCDFTDSQGNTYPPFPCRIYLPRHKKRYAANQDYKLHGTLLQKEPFSFQFKPERNSPWEPLANPWSWVEWRFEMKQRLLSHLKTHISDKTSSALLHSLITADVDERLLQMQLGKIGLQHMLAVSGFHFTLLALLLNVLVRPFLSIRSRVTFILLILSGYAFFVGPSPSVQRAFLAASITGVGLFFSWRAFGLNTLGICLMVELLIKPLNVLDLGFQLSFLCTFAILIAYPLCNRAIEKILPPRDLFTLKRMAVIDQIGALALTPLRSAMALNIAVHLFSIPVLLFFFHRFSWLSLAYNLCFPTGLALCLLMLFIALLLFPLFPLGAQWLYALNEYWTGFLLKVTAHPPALLDGALRTHHLNFTLLLVLLAALFLGCTALFEQREA